MKVQVQTPTGVQGRWPECANIRENSRAGLDRSEPLVSLKEKEDVVVMLLLL